METGQKGESGWREGTEADGRSRDTCPGTARAEARGGGRRRVQEAGTWVSGGNQTIPVEFRRAGQGEGRQAVRGQSGPHRKGPGWEKPGASQRPRSRQRGQQGPRAAGGGNGFRLDLWIQPHGQARGGGTGSATHGVSKAPSREAAGAAPPARGDDPGAGGRLGTRHGAQRVPAEAHGTQEPAGPRAGDNPESPRSAEGRPPGRAEA